MDISKIRVVVRVRPISEKERRENRKNIIGIENDCVIVNDDRSYKFDYVFGPVATQEIVYDTSIDELVVASLKGYNSTVMAYGQTGSGKTYTMGTGDNTNVLTTSEHGVVPRVISKLFENLKMAKNKAIEQGQTEPFFDISAQFVEIQNEKVFDLLSHEDKTPLALHEKNGDVYVSGATRLTVTNEYEHLSIDLLYSKLPELHRCIIFKTVKALGTGADRRKTSETPMNPRSSRSHAIFTLFIKQQLVMEAEESSETDELFGEEETKKKELVCLYAKFNFVDLAGSESIRRTGATGELAKEGININKGLLALGQVITALTKPGENNYIPYRQAKLTRILQDSLGGNSKTLIVACISPADCDYHETHSTLRYACQAREVKNKVVVNEDKSLKLIGSLRARIRELEQTLEDYRCGRVVCENGDERISDQREENVLLQADNDQLRLRVKVAHATIEDLSTKIITMTGKIQRLEREKTHFNENRTSDEQDSAEHYEKMETEYITPTLNSYMAETETLRIAYMENINTIKILNQEVTHWKSKFRSRKTPEIEETFFAPAPDEQKANGIGEDDVNEPTDGLQDEEDEETVKLKHNVDQLRSDIQAKEFLLATMESREQHNKEIQANYERKMADLAYRMQHLEKERDQILSDMSAKNIHKTDDRIRKIRDEYEKKMTVFKNEYKNLRILEKELVKLRAQRQIEQQQILRYRNELEDLKKTKIELMQKLKEMAQQKKAMEKANMKKVVDLEKQSRKKDNIIQKLQVKERQIEESLKKYNEEVNRLRVRVRQANESAKVTSAPNRLQNSISLSSSPRVSVERRMSSKILNEKAQKAWGTIETHIHRRINDRQALIMLEEELQQKLNERESLLADLKLLQKKYNSTIYDQERAAIGEVLDGYNLKLRMIHEDIDELHASVITFEGADVSDSGAKDLAAIRNAENVISECASLDEAKIIVRQFYKFCLEQGFVAAQATNDKKASILNLIIQNLGFRECNIQRLIANSKLVQFVKPHLICGDCFQKAELLAEELQNESKLTCALLQQVYDECDDNEEEEANDNSGDNFPASILIGSTNDELDKRTPKNDAAFLSEADKMDQLVKKIGIKSSKLIAGGNESYDSSSGDITTVPPTKFSGERNVKGTMLQYNPEVVSINAPIPQSRFLERLHSLVGHTKSVYTVDASDTIVITGSKDRTVKLWDINTGNELYSLGPHPNNVTSVRLIPSCSLALSSSLAAVRIWDLRSKECIRVFNSSGIAAADDSEKFSNVRARDIPPSESMINAAEVDQTGNLLFTTFRADVRIWNLQKLGAYGRLTGAATNIKSEVNCIHVISAPKPMVLTGSRDRCVKLFEIEPDGTGCYDRKYELTRQHFGPVTSVAAYGRMAFSACREKNIMRFSLDDGKRDHLEPSAHNAWIQSLRVIDDPKPLLLSACAGGKIKIWDFTSTKSLRLVDEVSYAHHGSINELAAFKNIVFSASSDDTVGVWRASL